ncbi:MAG: ankyrin repeat domain-containing protein [Candidatus Dependentiae bacterium]
MKIMNLICLVVISVINLRAADTSYPQDSWIVSIGRFIGDVLKSKEELLYIAFDDQKYTKMEQLLDKNEDLANALVPSDYMPTERSILMQAVIRGDIRAARMLLQHGADPNKGTRSLGTPLQQAVRRLNSGMVKLLIDYGVDTTRAREQGLVDFARNRGEDGLAASLEKASVSGSKTKSAKK